MDLNTRPEASEHKVLYLEVRYYQRASTMYDLSCRTGSDVNHSGFSLQVTVESSAGRHEHISATFDCIRTLHHELM